MSTDNTNARSDPAIIGTLKEDLRRGDFGRTIRREFRELEEYMMDEERKERLNAMGRVKRWLVLSWWLLKSMFFRLTPARRILIVAGLLIVFLSRTVIYSDGDLRIQGETNGLGILVILFVLMLELKDKLVAHDELKAGRAVQQALMPERGPRVPGWGLWVFTRAANEVGGDLVDFMKIGDRRFGLVLGDVAGKGLSAALLAAKLQATLRALVADVPSLSALGAKMNGIFCRDSLPQIFASLVYIEIAPDSGSVRFVNAGHIPPVKMRNGKLEKLDKGGVALGIMPEAQYSEQAVDLESGDLLLFYSDGLTEAQNKDGAFFDEQRLIDFLTRFPSLTAGTTGERLLIELDRFVGEANVHDDVSLVIMKKE